MKQLILMAVFAGITSICNAQVGCTKNNPLFNSDNGKAPKKVYELGSNPEFAFLKNLSTPEQVLSAIQNADAKNKRGVDHLDKLLVDVGFRNGVKDLRAENITEYYIPNGTVGNMGNGNHKITHSKLMAGGSKGVRSWKIESTNGCALYILKPCGNTFYSTNMPASTPVCVNVPLSVSSNTNDLTLEGGGINYINDRVYVYYHRKKCKKDDQSYVSAAIPDQNPSKPLLLSNCTRSEAIVSRYKLSITPQNTFAKVCSDTMLNVATNIGVEKETGYSGFLNKGKTEYRLVSKHAYKKAARKMSKAAKKESKVEYATGVNVSTCKS
jgi:hypothetical protein